MNSASVKLGDVCQIVSGSTPSTSIPEFWGGEFNWITPAEISEQSRTIYTTQKKLTQKALQKTALRKLPIGTVLLSSRAPIGKVAITGVEMYCNQGFKNLICSGAIHNKYLFWFLKKNTAYLNSLGRGATFKEISKDIVANIKIPLPEITIQKKYAAVLDKIDELFRKRQEQIVFLDTLVKSRFVEMFGEPQAVSTWKCCHVEDVAKVTVGVVIKPTQYYTNESDGIKAFRSLNIGEMFIKNDDWVYFSEEGHKANSKSILESGDVVVVRSGYPGTACVITEEFSGCNAVDIIIAKPNKNKIDSVYLAAFTNFPHGKQQILGKTGGAAQQHFNVGAYKQMTIALPPLNLQNKFSEFVKQTDKSKLALKHSLAELDMLKKALMQKFFG